MSKIARRCQQVGLAAVFAVSCPVLAFAAMYDLNDLTDAQKQILFKEVEKYAVVTAAMNYCARPPFLERRVRAVATGCATPQSLDAVERRFQEEVAKWSGKTDCEDKNLQRIFATATKKFGYLIDDITKACKYRVLYNFRLF
jgi:hypothetical protein